MPTTSPKTNRGVPPTSFLDLLQHRATLVKEVLLLLSFLCVLALLVLYKVLFLTNAQISFWTVYGFVATLFLVSRIPHAYLHEDNHIAKFENADYPDISIVIAAKNERAGIFKTIKTCVESRYAGKLECIVIDDGSDDGTGEEVERAEGVYGQSVKLITFPENRGKRAAMEAGINAANYEIIVFVDSDSFLYPDALRDIAEHFLQDNQVAAVSGNTKVDNVNRNTLTKMQSILYAISFDVYKASESVFNSVTCCPGCFSAYRKSVILPLIPAWRDRKFLGSKSTFGDDRGLTNFVLQGWKVIYCEKAKASTTVPERLSKYIRQQIRWKKSWIREGAFASRFMWKNRHPFASAAFYISFTFPIIGPVLFLAIIVKSIMNHNPIYIMIFMIGALLLGMAFALYVRVYHHVKNWYYMPLVSLLYFSVLIWLMPYAVLTLRRTHWGTR